MDSAKWNAAAVCRVAEVVRPAAGGMRRHVSDLLANLDRAQFTPILFAPNDFVPDRAVPHITRHDIEIGAVTRPMQDYRAVSQLAELLRGNVDIVHAHGLRGAVVGGFAARRARLPYLFTVHNLLPELNVVQARVFLSLARNAGRVIAVSEAVAQTLRTNGVAAEQIAVVPNGVDLSVSERPIELEPLRKELGLDTTAQIVLGVGRLSPEKGFDVLIEAFASLRAKCPDARLLLAGDGPEAPKLKQQAAPLGDRVRFLGHRSETAALFALSNLVVAPSRQEGQGIVPLEAMAASRAVIASRVGGLMETIVDGQTGLLVPVEDVSALADALQALLSDPDRRAVLGAAGRKRVEQAYSLQTQIQKTEAIYRDVFRRTT